MLENKIQKCSNHLNTESNFDSFKEAIVDILVQFFIDENQFSYARSSHTAPTSIPSHKPPHTITEPPPCLTIAVKFFGSSAAPDMRLTWGQGFKENNKNLLSSDPTTPVKMIAVYLGDF